MTAMKRIMQVSQPVAGWPLRLAQQVFSSLLDPHQGQPAGLPAASRRHRARQALQALSADERMLLDRWLALQLITTAEHGTRDAIVMLSRVDALLAIAVHRQVAHVVVEFAPPAC